jgi:cellulose synthase/poly-beta-1,6-N-acetylglucosamine synthase-like glycosyltransferase
VALLASLLLAVVQGVLVFCLGYQYFLALASIRRPRAASATGPARTLFAIAIPAHDEGPVLPATLTQLGKQAYPADLFDVHVVADHCTDDTAEVVQQGGGIAHVRDSLPKGRKAYALRWLLERLLRQEPAYDAVAIFDADSLVAPDFLRIMDRHLRSGKEVLQGQHVISNPEDSPLAAMAAVDMRLNNRMRNQSRRNLGFSCRLMGDAMVLDARVLRAYGWLGETLIEDREHGYELLLRGIRAHYVPEARSYGQAAGSWQQAQPQRLRWYRGVVAMQRRLALRLLAGAMRARSLAVLDGALELLTPSYTFLLALSIVNLGLTAGLAWLVPAVRGIVGLTGSALLAVAWGLYPLLGLIIDRAPAWAFRALLLGPAYLVWRLWISTLVRLRGDRIAWVRTRRREEGDGVAL